VIKPYEQGNLGTPTLFSVYEPIESYLDALQTALGGRADCPPAAPSFEAIDFYLLHQWIAQYATRPRVLDLAAEQTLGASTLFFLANARVREVQVLPPAERADGTPDWRPLLAAAVSDREVSPRPEYSVLPAGQAGEIRRCFPENELRPPLLVLLHVDEKTPGESLKNTLQELLALQADVVVAVCPLGRIGRCGVLESLVAYCASHREHRLAALREICPFTAASRLAILYRAANENAEHMLECLGQWFDGNFQFLSLARELTGRHLGPEGLNSKPAHIDEFCRSGAWLAFCKFQQARQRLLPAGSCRDQLARALWSAGGAAKNALRAVVSKFRKAA
jgi:hypothetical protein